MREVYTARFKDAHKYWWRIDLWKNGDVTFDTPQEKAVGINGHCVWDYVITNERMGNIDVPGYRKAIHDGEIQGQYDIVPDVQDVMLDYLAYTNGVAFGFSRHGEFKKAEEKES